MKKSGQLFLRDGTFRIYLRMQILWNMLEAVAALWANDINCEKQMEELKQTVEDIYSSDVATTEEISYALKDLSYALKV